jgi:hypothetical protein
VSRRTFAVPSSNEKPTRDCLDPWFFLILKATREVAPCCWHPPVGTLPPGGSLDDIVNNQEMRELRRQLLTGELNSSCEVCPARSLTDPETLLRRLREKLDDLASVPATAAGATVHSTTEQTGTR